MQIVIRPTYHSFDILRLQAILPEILCTEYLVGAQDSDAPSHTDCVTAVRYLLRSVSDCILPHAYIGDMAGLLIEGGSHKVSLQTAQAGDLVFFEKMSQVHHHYMIVHIGLVISDTEFFHSSQHFSGGQITSLHDPEYMSLVLDESYLPLAHDPRHHD